MARAAQARQAQRHRQANQIRRLSKGASADAAGGADSGQGDPNSVGIFRAGIVFVVDTTVSMQTYLDQTREIVKDFYKALDEAGMAQFAGFGLIGFRSDTKAVPGLEYTTKIFVDPNDVEGSEDFLKKTEQLRPPRSRALYSTRTPSPESPRR